MIEPDPAKQQVAEYLATLDPGEILRIQERVNSQQTRDGVWARCERDPCFMFTTYFYTVNLYLEADGYEEERPELYPGWAYQRDMLIPSLVEPKNLLIEKTRDMMLTWTVCCQFLHDLMFYPSAPMLMTSRAGHDVDDGGENSTHNSLLGRIRYIYERLPAWMKQRAPLRFKKGVIQNTANAAFIQGLKAVEHTGRQGKYRRIFADEFGHFDFSEAQLAALKPACPKGLILGSTPGRTGRDNCFGRLATDYDGDHGGFTLVTLHWSIHPLRGDDWYENQKAALSDEDVARELDIDYEGSVTAKVYPIYDRSVHFVEGLEYDPDLPLFTLHDHGLNEETVHLVQLAGGGQYRIIDRYQFGLPEGKQTDPWQSAERMVRILGSEPYNLPVTVYPDVDDEEKEIAVVSGLKGSYGDPAGKRDELTVTQRKTDDNKLTSYHSVWSKYGFHIKSQFSKQKDGVTLVRRAMGTDPPELVIADNERTLPLHDAFTGHRFKKDARTGRVLDSLYEDSYKHDMDCVRYLFINRQKIATVGVRRKPRYRQIWTRSSTGARYPKMVRYG